MRLVLFQPDIPQNTGAVLRLCACFDIPMDIIEPCGFVWSDAKLRRAGLDYIAHAHVQRYQDFDHWKHINKNRLVLLTTKANINYCDFRFMSDDALMLGQESQGVPDWMHTMSNARVKIPMQPKARSLNQAMTAAIVTSEALRQIHSFS